jgi:bifunctional enzyme CysN/CysC
LSATGEQKGLLRFLTAGSVDDGKSTLLGRLLFESEGVYDDQLDSLRKSAGNGSLDLALITDGLRAEREQAITIDVAYRYFSTPKRTFIIADTPGHEQYTRNMVTGASTASLAILLVDARKGLQEQTRRHAYILWLLGIRKIVVGVNKMDLVGFAPGPFREISRQFAEATASMQGLSRFFVPLSALAGDNVVRRSGNMPWYEGPALLELLETVPLEEDRCGEPLRLPVQTIIRPHQDFRGYAGQITSGKIRKGQEVVTLPSGQRATVTEIFLYRQSLEEAISPQSVLVCLSPSIDVGRGDLLADAGHLPLAANRVIADLIWMSQTPLRLNSPYLIKHGSRVLCCRVVRVLHKVDIGSFQNMEAETLAMNEIGLVEIEAHKPMFFDPYCSNRATGSFILIDPATDDTAAAAMISEDSCRLTEYAGAVAGPEMVALARQDAGLTVWFTGLSGSGKTTICNSVYTELLARGLRVEVLDGDVVRIHLNSDLGFGRKDRDENILRIGFVAQLLAQHGVIVLVSAISPYRSAREEVRRRTQNFLEVYVSAPLNVCEQRDPKGLYKKARAGEIRGFTGIDDPYEPPLAPDVQCNTDQMSIKAATEKVLAAVLRHVSANSRPNAMQAGSALSLPCTETAGQAEIR